MLGWKQTDGQCDVDFMVHNNTAATASVAVIVTAYASESLGKGAQHYYVRARRDLRLQMEPNENRRVRETFEVGTVPLRVVEVTPGKLGE